MENKKKGFLLGRRASEGYFLSTATRALIIGVAVIVVCIVCSLALYMSKQGKAAINTGTNQYNKMLEDYQDLNKAMYRNLPSFQSNFHSICTVLSLMTILSTISDSAMLIPQVSPLARHVSNVSINVMMVSWFKRRCRSGRFSSSSCA